MFAGLRCDHCGDRLARNGLQACLQGAQGFARREINGGFEWVNFYRGSRVPRIVVGAADGRTIPKTKVADFCVSVYVDPVPDTRRILASRPYAGLTRSDGRIVAVRNRCRER